MFIKKLKPNIYDVFVGNGWGDWTRVRRNHWGVSVIDGKRLSRETLNKLNERLVK